MSSKMARNKYPKPLIFHDGRLAFLPTPSSSLSLLLWLPFATLLSIVRVFIGCFLPYKASLPLTAATGFRLKLNTNHTTMPPRHNNNNGVLYVCNHRTLLDPVMLSSALQRSIPAVTYSLSRLSEIISPIKTVRLVRERSRDAATIRRLLCDGDVAVCPEGTTCREPYLLRFSSLFGDLADEIVAVAMDVCVDMFYGTTVSGRKWLDPFVFMMNPTPEYRIQVLGRVPPFCQGGERLCATEVANWVQRRIGEALGFECTQLTRKDKYMILVGSDGRVLNK